MNYKKEPNSSGTERTLSPKGLASSSDRHERAMLRGLSYEQQVQMLRPGADSGGGAPVQMKELDGSVWSRIARFFGWGSDAEASADTAPVAAPAAAPVATVTVPTVPMSNTLIDIQDLTRYIREVDSLLVSTESTSDLETTALWAELARQMDVAGGELSRVSQQIDQTLAAVMRTSSPLNETTNEEGEREQPTQPDLPTLEQLAALRQAIQALQQRVRQYTETVGEEGAGTLNQGLTEALDASVALTQSRAVISARADWVLGYRQPELDGSAADNVNDASGLLRGDGGGEDGLDALYQDSGFNRWGTQATRVRGDWEPLDWCGMFVGSQMFRSAGFDTDLRAGMWETSNVHDFFNYTQESNSNRIPVSVWSEGEQSWTSLASYHQLRGSARHWTTRESITAALAEDRVPFRSGDVALINHSGGTDPQHIVMVDHYRPDTGELVTIEGNTKGIHSNSDGGVERNAEGHARRDSGDATSVGFHVREMTENPTAETETEENRGRHAYENRAGNTVVGVGRFSAVDYEDHRYATLPIGNFPEAALTMSPAQMEAARSSRTRDAVGLKG